MKKIVLSLAGVLAATAFAPEASAVPSFARQTGMACSACHQQHFPVLNGFGQAFKAAGYTMMGSQGKVEGEHLSIPDTLNASMLFKARYQKTNGQDTVANAAVNGATTNDGQWQIPDEFSLFLGGRIAENIGFIFEGNVAGSMLVAGFKMPITFDMGGATIGVAPFTTDNLGVGTGFELASNGLARGNRWNEHADWINAANYVGIGNGAHTGVALYAKNDMGFVNLTRYGTAFTAGAGATQELKSNWLRIAATPTFGDWATIIGAGFASGHNNAATCVSPVVGASCDTKATMFDAQAQGQLGGKDISLYFAHVKAPSTTNGNVYNNIARPNSGGWANHTNGNAGQVFAAAGTSDKKAWNLGAEYSVIPHTLHIGANYLAGNTGGAAAGQTDKVRIWSLTAVYDLYQNVGLVVNHSKASGSAYNALTGTLAPAVAVGGLGDSLTTFMLEAAW